MSVLFKSNNSLNYDVINKDSGYPTYDVYDASITQNGSLSVLIKWKDPEDTKVDNIVLAQWKSTLLVRKIGSVPNSINDGIIILENTIRNQYSDTGYVDTNLIENNDYYYRFFTYSKDNVLGDGSPTLKITARVIDPILENNSWSVISDVSESGQAKNIWNIGDKKSIGSHTVSIIGFDHYNKSDGSGKAGITFMFDQVIMNNAPIGIDSVDNEYWNKCYGRTYYMTQFFNSFPEELQNSIKEVKIKSYTERTYSDSGYTVTSNDRVFIPSPYEMGLYSSGKDEEKFSIFTNDKSRIRKYNGNECQYWTRMHCKIGTSSYSSPGYRVVDRDGGPDSEYKDATYKWLGYVPIFNV